MPLRSSGLLRSILLAVVACDLLVAAGSKARYEFAQVHMGLPVRIVLYAAADRDARDAATAAFSRIAALDQAMSDYRPDSELTRLNTRPGEWVVVTADVFEVARCAVEIARLTDGAFDPSVGPLVALWREARRTRRLPSPAALAAARAAVGWDRIEIDQTRRAIRLGAGMRLDLGGIAKGYILQEALRIVATRGVTRAMVEAGGDIVVSDAPPGRSGWQIEAPAAGAFADRARRLTHAALATSGPTAQFVEIDGVRYSHVIDPRRGIGLTHDLVAHVIAPDAAIADALATAATVLGPEGASIISQRFPSALVSLSLR